MIGACSSSVEFEALNMCGENKIFSNVTKFLDAKNIEVV